MIAAGPTVGVLAYDLTINGYQALDIGHLDIEYEWFLRGTEDVAPIATKYTNDVLGLEEATEEVHDPIYKAQIIADFSIS